MVMSNIIVLLYLAFPVGIGAVIQYFLCKAEAKWLGWILPILSFVVSLAISGGILTYALMGISGTNVIFLGILCFFLANMPTLLFYLIYREGNKRKSLHDVDKMSLKDF